jgi:hypothetical protein
MMIIVGLAHWTVVDIALGVASLAAAGYAWRHTHV